MWDMYREAKFTEYNSSVNAEFDQISAINFGVDKFALLVELTLKWQDE